MYVYNPAMIDGRNSHAFGACVRHRPISANYRLGVADYSDEYRVPLILGPRNL